MTVSVRPEFFEVAAQLVPVLLIAAAVDARGWGSRAPHSHGEAIGELVGLAALGIAWLLSLFAVAFGLTSGIAFAVVLFGLAVGWTEVVTSIAYGHLKRVRHARITRRLRAWALASALTPLLVAAGVGFFVV